MRHENISEAALYFEHHQLYPKFMQRHMQIAFKTTRFTDDASARQKFKTYTGIGIGGTSSKNRSAHLYLCMLNTKNIEPAQAASYYALEDGYYASKNTPQPSTWWGKLAAQMALEGEVNARDLIHVLHGNAPNGIRMRGHKHSGKTRAAVDAVFRMPKSAGLQALVKGDTRILEAHRQAVNTVLKEIEDEYSIARIRTGGIERREVMGKLLVAQFFHITSRAGDPLPHTHCIIMNALYCRDGQWRSLSNERFYRDNKRALGVRYQQELAQGIEKLGYEVVWKDNDTFEIKGYTRNQVLAFSQRRVQIEKEVGHSDGTWKEYQAATLKTRKAKEERPIEELQQDWQRRAHLVGLPNLNPQAQYKGVVIPFPVQPQVSNAPQTQEDLTDERPASDNATANSRTIEPDRAAEQVSQRDDELDATHPQERAERLHGGVDRGIEKPKVREDGRLHRSALDVDERAGQEDRRDQPSPPPGVRNRRGITGENASHREAVAGEGATRQSGGRSHWQSAQPLDSLIQLAQAINEGDDLAQVLESDLPEQLTEFTARFEPQSPVKFKGLAQLATEIQGQAENERLAESFAEISKALSGLQQRVDRVIEKAEVQAADNALAQWRVEQRIALAATRRRPKEGLDVLEQSRLPIDLRPQMKELMQALNEQHEMESVAQAAAQISDKLQQLSKPQLRGLPELAEAIHEQQAFDDVALAMSQVSLRLERTDRYPKMAELAGWIHELGGQQALLNPDLAQQLQALGEKVERLTEPPTPWVGMQPLAEAIRERSLTQAISEHRQPVEALQQKVEQWLQQRPEMQQITEMVMALRGGPLMNREPSAERLKEISQQLKEMNVNVTPKPQKRLREDWQERPKVIPIKQKQPVKQPEPSYEQKVEWLRPAHIDKQHWKELVIDSRIKPSVAYDSYRSVDGEEARALLLTYALGNAKGHGQQYATGEIEMFLERYEHLQDGGLWCIGESIRGEEWGQLKPNTPVIETKEDKRYRVKLKGGNTVELQKPEGYQQKTKTRKYESIPKAPKKDGYEHVESLRSHFCFCDDRKQLMDDPQIPIVFTEGSKKGASIYSNTGNAAIALNGVYGGYEVTQAETRVLGEHLRGYDWEDRKVLLWFDRDPIEKVKTQEDVAKAMHVFGRLLTMAGAEVEVAEMTGPVKGKLGADDYLAKGKGMDDLKVSTFQQWAEQNPYVQAAVRQQQQEAQKRLLEQGEDMER